MKSPTSFRLGNAHLQKLRQLSKQLQASQQQVMAMLIEGAYIVPAARAGVAANLTQANSNQDISTSKEDETNVQ